MLARPNLSASSVQCFSIPVDENGFVDWLIDAQPGDTLIYYRGHLSHDRMPSAKIHNDIQRRKLGAVASRVLVAETQGLVIPVQRRVATNDWLYLAIRTRGALSTTHNHKPSKTSARSLHHA
jgi:hypothetical protein